MEKGGSFDKHLNAVLADGSSANCWPLTGYTYFIIRTTTHLGSCTQRKAAMNFLYNFYYSDAVTEIALRLGYATLPSFIRDIVANVLVSIARCSNGQLALGQYQKSLFNIYSTTSIAQPFSTYLSAYNTIDASILWNLTSLDNSDAVWDHYLSSPLDTVCALTMFMSAETKKMKYFNTGPHKIHTAAFAHVAVVPLYHLASFSARVTTPLRLTADILAKIYLGEIIYWNDSLIQQANLEHKYYLPYQKIIVVCRLNSSDTNQIFTRYLATVSSEFADVYGINRHSDGSKIVNFQLKVPPNRLVYALDNIHVDSSVTFHDGSIGYYLNIDPPVSPIAYFCLDAYCMNVVTPNAASSLSACESDPSTRVSLGSDIISYDLMLSNSSNCYPIVGTIDYSVALDDNVPSCALGANGVAYQSVEFGAWIFNGTTMTQPLNALSIAGTSTALRYATQQRICQIKCANTYLGYNFCSYRDCTWIDGDYVEYVTNCNSMNEKRKVTYEITQGNTCIQNTARSPPNPVYIQCEYVMPTSTSGIACYVLCAFGTSVCILLIIYELFVRKKTLRNAKLPLYELVFMFGALFMNLTIVVFVGPNSDSLCFLRIWLYNLSLTIMYGPLVMKLFAVNSTLTFMRRLQKWDKTLVQVMFLVLVDLVILVSWSIADPPRSVAIKKSFANVYQDVVGRYCNVNQDAQYVMVAYKLFMLGGGGFKAISTWHVTAEISEAKQFSVAIAVGFISYAIGVFVNWSTDGGIIVIQCVSIFFSGTVSLCLIMLPKFAKKKVNTIERAPRLGASTDGPPVHSNANGPLAPAPIVGNQEANQVPEGNITRRSISDQVQETLRSLASMTKSALVDDNVNQSPQASPGRRGSRRINVRSVNDSIEKEEVNKTSCRRSRSNSGDSNHEGSTRGAKDGNSLLFVNKDRSDRTSVTGNTSSGSGGGALLLFPISQESRIASEQSDSVPSGRKDNLSSGRKDMIPSARRKDNFLLAVTKDSVKKYSREVE